jgi:hypothetical protein
LNELIGTSAAQAKTARDAIAKEILRPNTVYPTIWCLWVLLLSAPIFLSKLSLWFYILFAIEAVTIAAAERWWPVRTAAFHAKCFVAREYQNKRLFPSLYRLTWRAQAGARFFGYAFLTAMAALVLGAYSYDFKNKLPWQSALVANISSGLATASAGLFVAGALAYRRRLNAIKFGAGLTMQRMVLGFRVDQGEFASALNQLRVGFSNPDSKVEVGLIRQTTQIVALELANESDIEILRPLAEKLLVLLNLSTPVQEANWFDVRLKRLTTGRSPTNDASVRTMAEQWIGANIGSADQRKQDALAFVDDWFEGHNNAPRTFAKAMERSRKGLRK